MQQIATGWGSEAPAGNHYCKPYRNRDDLVWLTVECISAGLRSSEQVFHALDPHLLIQVMEELEHRFPDLKERIAAGQLVQRLRVQCCHVWMHGGSRALGAMLDACRSEAKGLGFHAIRWVGHASGMMYECSSPVAWFGMESALRRLLPGEHEVPFTIFCLYPNNDIGQGVAESHILLDEPQYQV